MGGPLFPGSRFWSGEKSAKRTGLLRILPLLERRRYPHVSLSTGTNVDVYILCIENVICYWYSQINLSKTDAVNSLSSLFGPFIFCQSCACLMSPDIQSWLILIVLESVLLSMNSKLFFILLLKEHEKRFR